MLAVIDDGPVLLVTAGGVPTVTAAELRRLQPDRIVIDGGSREVSADVERALGGFARSVERVAGADRFETAVALS